MPTFYDSRRVLQLASDSGTAALPGDLSNTSSAAYALMQNAIITAASELDTHCQIGQRYTTTVLEAIIANALANPTDLGAQKSAGLIRQLVADLAFGILASRRGYRGKTLDEFAPRYDAALVTLERISRGDQVFNQQQNLTAGVPSVGIIGQCAYRPSIQNRLFPVWGLNGPYGCNPYFFFGR